MLHLAFLAGFIATCVMLMMIGTWTRANIWTVSLGVLLLVIGALMEAFRFERSKTVTDNRNQLFRPPDGDRSRIIQVGWGLSWVLLAASYFALGLIVLVFQVLVFFGS